jgi:kynurenine formamidase
MSRIFWTVTALWALQFAQAQTLSDIASGKARVIDLCYPLNAKTAYWPIGNYHPFQFRVIATIKKDGVFSGEYSTPEHLGTHLDAPNHFEPGKKSVDQLSLQALVAPFVVIDISSEADRDPDIMLTVAQVQSWEQKNGKIPQGTVVLLQTGWARYWGSPRYANLDAQKTLHFPGYSPEVARFLVQERDIKGIGIDNLSVDRGMSKKFEVHHIVNGAQRYHLENIANMTKLPPKGGFVIVAPIKIEGGSGGQARIWAVLE